MYLKKNYGTDIVMHIHQIYYKTDTCVFNPDLLQILSGQLQV